jgi:hypothetical protein
MQQGVTQAPAPSPLFTNFTHLVLRNVIKLEETKKVLRGVLSYLREKYHGLIPPLPMRSHQLSRKPRWELRRILSVILEQGGCIIYKWFGLQACYTPRGMEGVSSSGGAAEAAVQALTNTLILLLGKQGSNPPQKVSSTDFGDELNE